MSKLEAHGRLLRFVDAPAKPHMIYMGMTAHSAEDAAELARRWNLHEKPACGCDSETDHKPSCKLYAGD